MASAHVESKDRSNFTTIDIARDIWQGLNLPADALECLNLTGEGNGLPSSFKVGALAQTTIALSALSAALVHSYRTKSIIPRITVPLRHAVTEFRSERYWLLNGNPNPYSFSAVGGVHRTQDGYVRIHDGFPHHRDGAFRLLGLNTDASKQDVAAAALKWKALDLESRGIEKGLVIAALRSFEEWDKSPQAPFVASFPISVKRLHSKTVPGVSPNGSLFQIQRLNVPPTKCLQGLRVLDLSRVIAAPLAGKTLAAHGADVLWVTSPKLPDIPEVDIDIGRGKRTIQLDLHIKEDRETLMDLAQEADVFLQGYRPGALEALGFGPEQIAAVNPSIIYANLSAYGSEGPWSQRRGFDSIVQTGSGLNVAEAEHYGQGNIAQRSLPCQALDHGSGYLLATGISTALYKRSIEGGAWIVDVSLAGTMAYLRSLGQWPGNAGFDCEDIRRPEVIPYLETKNSGFGELKAVSHSAHLDAMEVGWDIMPKKLGSDKPQWL
jgi:CoA transferase family III